MRADVILDLTGKAGSRVSVVDRFYEGLDYRLIDLAYDDTILRDHRPDWAMALSANPLSEPDLSNAFRHDVVFNGGMMGGMIMQEMGGSMGDGACGGMMGRMGGMGDMINMMTSGKIWSINGDADEGHVMDTLLTLSKGPRNPHPI